MVAPERRTPARIMSASSSCDRVLGLIVAHMLLEAYPAAPEGELSVRLNALVNADTLASIAEEIGLPALVHAGSRSGRWRAPRQLARRRTGGADCALTSTAAWKWRAFIHRYWRPRAEADVMRRRQDGAPGMGYQAVRRPRPMRSKTATARPRSDLHRTVSVGSLNPASVAAAPSGKQSRLPRKCS
jgi:hypothetical protein